MANPKIKFKRSAVLNKRPDINDLELGELAINTYDGRVFVRRDTSGAIGVDTGNKLVNPWTENNSQTGIAYTGEVNITGITTFNNDIVVDEINSRTDQGFTKIVVGNEQVSIHANSPFNPTLSVGAGNTTVIIDGTLKVTQEIDCDSTLTVDSANVVGVITSQLINVHNFQATGVTTSFGGFFLKNPAEASFDNTSFTFDDSGSPTFDSDPISAGIYADGSANFSGIVTSGQGFIGNLTGNVTGTADNANDSSKLNNQLPSYYLDYSNFTNTPTLIVNNNQLTNGAGYITTSFTDTNQLVNSAGFVTFTNNNQLTNGAGYITTSFTNTNQLTNGAGFITTSFTNTNQLTNGAGFITTSFTNTNQLTNGAGFISNVVEDTTPELGGGLDLNGYTITGAGVTITAFGQVNVTGVVTASSFVGDLTGTASQSITVGGVTTSYLLDYDNFTNTPTLITNNNQLTNGAGYITTSFVNTNQLTNGAGFITTSFTDTNQLTNGAGFITTSFTNTNQLVNGAGFITDDITGNFSVSGVSTFTGDINANNVSVGGTLSLSGSGSQFFAYNEDTVKVKFANWYSSNDRQYGMGQLWFETWFGAIDNQAARANRRIGFYLEEPNAGSTDSGTPGQHPTNDRAHIDINGLYVDNNLEVNENLLVVGIATFQGNVSIAGTLTYEDVENIDSVGLITARSGVRITGGGLDVVGVSTFNDDIYVDQIRRKTDNSTNTKIQLNAGQMKLFAGNGTTAKISLNGTVAITTNTTVTGILTATSFSGDGSTLSNIPTSIIAGDNISVSGSTGAVTITGLANTTNVSADTLVVSGISTLGVVTGATYYGDGSNLTGVANTANVISDTIQSGIITATEQFYPPSLTTVERDGLSFNAGAFIFNETENKLQMYLGGQWKNLAFELDSYSVVGL